MTVTNRSRVRTVLVLMQTVSYLCDLLASFASTELNSTWVGHFEPRFIYILDARVNVVSSKRRTKLVSEVIDGISIVFW